MRFPALTRLGWHVTRAAVLRQRLSFRDEAAAITAKLDPALVILGRENIPTTGPAVITVNHYARPGFQALWLALAISAAVPVEVHWIMAAAWTDPQRWKSFWKTPLTEFVFKEIARVFDFTTMPPMPPTPEQAAWRAQSVRQVLRFIQDSQDDRGMPTEMIGLAPEGGDNHAGVLSAPPPGSGRFIQQMARHGLAILPVGAFVDERGFCLNFGPAYRLEELEAVSRVEVDRQIASQVLGQIAALLPPELHGVF